MPDSIVILLFAAMGLSSYSEGTLTFGHSLFDGEELYPRLTPLLDILKDWKPEDVSVPLNFKEIIPNFNFSDITDRKHAKLYRDLELPFKLYDVPPLDSARMKWKDDFLKTQFKNKNVTIEWNTNQHFLFWKIKGKPNSTYKSPTSFKKIPFNDWIDYANKVDKDPKQLLEYQYFYENYQRNFHRLNFIGKDLQFICPPRNNFFIVNTNANIGIECRFGMRGIIAESHYDTGRNMVVMIRGSKRYILTPPSTCNDIGIIKDIRHPSFRQSFIDWNDLKQAEASRFSKIPAIDTVVREGEVLYIPSFWFHYIVSLDLSIQCNSRSGTPPQGQGKKDIDECLGSTLALNK
eukprot:gene2352-4565_t